MSYKKGFTLLEILLVVGIIAILAGVVIVAINPSKQLATVRNAQRISDLKQIYNAVEQYYIDHSGYPSSIPTTLTEICDTGASSTPVGIDCTGLVDLSSLVPTYLVAIPKDPQPSVLAFPGSFVSKAYAVTNGTGYQIMKNSSNKIILNAPQAEIGTQITLGTTTSGEGSACFNNPSTGFYAGSGTVNDPYQICGWSQLNNIRNHLSSSYILNNNLSVATPGYIGFGDSWVPIGNNPTPFTGNFNGNGKTISGLSINLPGTNYVGLFGYLAGNISNIGLINVNIIGTDNVGGLIGASSGTTTNSYITGDILSSGTNAGGLVGNLVLGTVSNSYSTANVTGSSAVGGLVGLQTAGSISKSFSTGRVIGTSLVGGLIGNRIAGTALYSRWDKDTSGQPTSAGLGLTGRTTAQMKNVSTFNTATWNIYTSSTDLNNGYPYLGWQNSDNSYIWFIYLPPDITPPNVTAFTLPAADSLLVYIINFTATDDRTVAGYLLTESSSVPSVGDSRWSSTPPATYVFDSAGSKTLYAWAKDAAGNISTSMSASVTVSIMNTVTDLNVLGATAPDATGGYYISGVYDGKPVYTRISGGYYIWPNSGSYCLSTSVGSCTTAWSNSASSTGIYYPVGGYTGNATVEAVEIRVSGTSTPNPNGDYYGGHIFNNNPMWQNIDGTYSLWSANGVYYLSPWPGCPGSCHFWAAYSKFGVYNPYSGPDGTVTVSLP